MSPPEPGRAPGEQDDIPSFIGGTPEERTRIARLGSCLLRSCLVAVVATMIFEGVVLGWTKFGWVGAVLGPFAIYFAGTLLGLLGSMALLVLAHFASGEKIARRSESPGPRRPIRSTTTSSTAPRGDPTED